MAPTGVKVVASNRRARHDYAILETLEAGLVPLVDQGAPGGEETKDAFEAEFDAMFPPHTIVKG